MAVSPITLPGQLNGSGNDDTLFWRLFAGEVLTAFHRENKFMPLHRVRTIANGKSATFPITGTATAKYHTAGSSVFRTDDGDAAGLPGNAYLSQILGKEKEIFVDDPLVSGVFVASIDEMKNHWDHRSIYTTEIGKALAESADRDVLSTILAAARKDPAATDGSFSSMPVAPGDYSKVCNTWADATVGANLANFCFRAAEIFDTYDVPKESRYVAMRPKQYYALASVKDLVDRDISQGNGDYAQAAVLRVAGLQVVMSNAFKSSNDSAVAASGVRNDPHGGGGNGYNCDWSICGALAFTPDAAATVKMKEMSVASEYQLDRLGHLILAHYVMGHNTLRPECAIEMRVTTI